MWVNIFDIEMIEVADRKKAVALVKKKLKQWMQKGDRLVWTVREVWGDSETEPGLAQVYNEVGEQCDAFAEIFNTIPKNISRAVAGKILMGEMITFREYKIALAAHYLLNHGQDLQAEYAYLRNVWHYEDDKIRGFLNFKKPQQDEQGFRLIEIGVDASQVKRDCLNEKQIAEFRRNGWKDEEIGH